MSKKKNKTDLTVVPVPTGSESTATVNFDVIGVDGVPTPIIDSISELLEIYAAKAADYAQDDNPFSNFYDTSQMLGTITAPEAALFNICQKVARIKALKLNARDPQNESVLDSYKDLAVYAVIAYSLAKEAQ